MSETLVIRVRRVISAQVNDLVDAMESSNADSVMREAIREVERAMDDVRAELGQIMAQRSQTTRQMEKVKERIAELGAKVDFAVSQSRDDLAEAAIARQVDLERQVPVLEASINDLSAKCTELEGYVAALAGRKSEMEADLAAFADARRSAGLDAPNGTPASVMQSADRRADMAGRAFNRAMGVNAPAAAADAKSRRETAEKIQEIETIERASLVAERLAAAKAKRVA